MLHHLVNNEKINYFLITITFFFYSIYSVIFKKIFENVCLCFKNIMGHQFGILLLSIIFPSAVIQGQIMEILCEFRFSRSVWPVLAHLPMLIMMAHLLVVNSPDNGRGLLSYVNPVSKCIYQPKLLFGPLNSQFFLSDWMASENNIVIIVIGCRQFGSQTEEENLRYHQCSGRHWAHWKEDQKHHSVEVSTKIKKVINVITKCFCLTFYEYCIMCSLRMLGVHTIQLRCSLKQLLVLIRGESSGCQPQEFLEQVELLKVNIADLEIQERELDMQKACLQQSIKHLNEDPSSCRYPYSHCMSQKTLIFFFSLFSSDIFPFLVGSPGN